MVRFEQDHIEMFLNVVRKYMAIRGAISQKELAEQINVGISTMSRFLNQKTKEYDAQMIASIVAYLNIPLHEIIEFIAEDSTQTFKKLVAFYKESLNADSGSSGQAESTNSAGSEEQTRTTAQASIKGVKVPFGERGASDSSNLSIKEKLNQLSPRQKGFLTDFLELDVEGRDLIVDIGNQLFRYFKQGQANF